MKKITKLLTVFTFLAAAFSAQQSWAQGGPFPNQIIIGSGGDYSLPNNKVTFYAYSFTSNKVTAFDSVPGRFTKAAVVSNDTAYITADSVLYRYYIGLGDTGVNKQTIKKIDSVILPGINEMKIYNNYLIVSRWYPATDKLVQIYDKSSLKLLYNDTHATNQANGILINEDTAYIAIQNDTFGMLEEISLSQSTPKFVKLIKLDTTSKDLQDIFTYRGNIYGLSYYFANSYDNIVTYNLLSGKASSKMMDTADNGVYFYSGNIYADFGKGLQAYNITTQAVGSPISTIDYVACVPENDEEYPDYFYLIKSNFITNDTVFIVTPSGKIINHFVVGKSSQALASQWTDIGDGIKPTTSLNQHITLYPNPSNNKINIQYPANEALITISDITGRTVYSENKTGINSGATIDVSGMANGVYIVHLVSESGVADVKFIKE